MLLIAHLLWCRVAAVEKAEAAKINVVKAAEADAEAKFLQGQVGALTGRRAAPTQTKSKTHVQLRLSGHVEAQRQMLISSGCRGWTVKLCVLS